MISWDSCGARFNHKERTLLPRLVLGGSEKSLKEPVKTANVQADVQIGHLPDEPGQLSQYSALATGWTIRRSNPGKGRDIPVLQNVYTGPGAHQRPVPWGYSNQEVRLTTSELKNERMFMELRLHSAYTPSKHEQRHLPPPECKLGLPLRPT